MITNKQLRAALVDCVRVQAGLPYEIHFARNEESSASYFFIEFSERRRTVDPVYYERRISVDISLVLLPDEFNRIDKNTLRDAADTLDSTIRPILRIGDRRVTVLDISHRIVDDILHYSFALEFTDYLPVPEKPVMETLDMTWDYAKEEG